MHHEYHRNGHGADYSGKQLVMHMIRIYFASRLSLFAVHTDYSSLDQYVSV